MHHRLTSAETRDLEERSGAAPLLQFLYRWLKAVGSVRKQEDSRHEMLLTSSPPPLLTAISKESSLPAPSAILQPRLIPNRDLSRGR